MPASERYTDLSCQPTQHISNRQWLSGDKIPCRFHFAAATAESEKRSWWKNTCQRYQCYYPLVCARVHEMTPLKSDKIPCLFGGFSILPRLLLNLCSDQSESIHGISVNTYRMCINTTDGAIRACMWSKFVCCKLLSSVKDGPS